ncbi:MAG: cellulase family glycosylhydrolase [Roseburia sp.]|nr:cellulase family glycosylhydrolase [Roseburia sp.]
MRKNKRVLAVLLSAAMTIASLTSGGTGGVPARAATSTSSFQDLNQQQITEAMGVGYNLGNSLEANDAGTPNETAWGNPKLTEQFVLAAKSAGFQSIRIPVSYLNKIDDNNGYQIDSAWLDRVQEVVDYCVKNDMYAIVNMHGDGYTTINGGWLLCGSSDQTKIREKYKACWQQIATRFKDYDEHLIFESMNEEFDGTYGDPNRTHYENINTYNQIFVDTVRQTGGNNDKRWLLIPGWNTDINYTVGDYGFALPTDQYLSSGVAAGEKRIMISVHYYAPWEFCGTESQAVTQWGSKATDSTKKASWGDESYMVSQFKKLKDKFVSQGYPVVIGEFGAINKSSIDSQNTVCRADFYQKVCYYAKQNGLVPVAWDNGYNGVYGFCLIDRSTNTVAHPEVVNAVMEIYRASSTATGISLDKDRITVSVGDAGVQLNASLTPADSQDLISWSSDDDTVATVSSSGLVTAVGAGSCTITASVAGGYKAECKVTVPKPTYIRTKLYMMNTNDWGTTVSEESADITTADQEYTMTLKVTDTQLQNIGSLYLKDIQATEPEDSPISYATLKVKSITVNGKEYSMNNSVFTYNSSLKSTTGKANNVFDFAFVNIWAITYIDDVTTESKKAYFNGVSYQGTNTISMTFEVSDVKANGTETPSAVPSSTPKVTTSPSTVPSSTPKVTTSPSAVPSSTPKVTTSPSAVPSSTPKVTVSPSDTPAPGLTPSAEPSETPAPSDTAQPSAEPSETSAPSDTAKPSAEPSQTPAPGETDKPSASPSQTPAPSDTTTPSASPSQTPAPGNTKAPGTGPSATSGTNGDNSHTAMSFTLKASVKGVKNLSVGTKYKLAAGKKMTLSADFITDTDDQEVSFTSSKSSVVKVNENGVVKAGKKTGKAVITVTAADGTSRKVTVQVMKKAVKKLAIKKGSRSLKKGKKLKLKVQAKPGKKLASNQYYWKTSSAKKATVSAKGIVKAKQKGTVRITVYATDGSGKKASVKLQVK